MKLKLFLLGVLAPVALFGFDVMFVDIERMVLEVEEGVLARNQLQQETEAKQNLLEDRKNKIEKLQESLSKQGNMLKDAAKKQIELDLQKQMAEAQQMYLSMQQELSQREQQLMGGIVQKAKLVLEEIRRKRGLDAIMPKANEHNMAGGALAVKSSLDITNEAIREYNEVYKIANKASDKKSDVKKDDKAKK